VSTLADLRKRFYARFDEQGQAYIGTDEANSLLNEGAAQLHNWLVTEGEAYVWQETVVPFVAQQADYPLPATLLKLLKVFASSPVSPGTLMPLPRIMPQEYRGGSFANPAAYSLHQPRGYMMMGQTLRIVPTPSQSAGSVTLWWAPQYQPLVADTDTTPLSMFVGSLEFIINQAVIGARLKEESDTTALERRQAQILQMIQQTLINRDMGQHSRVVDASGPCL
jgi:hypothetical protein